MLFYSKSLNFFQCTYVKYKFVYSEVCLVLPTSSLKVPTSMISSSFLQLTSMFSDII